MLVCESHASIQVSQKLRDRRTGEGELLQLPLGWL
jgi:hypothetical protein